MKISPYRKYYKSLNKTNSIKYYISVPYRNLYEKYDRKFFNYIDEAIENYAIYKSLYGGSYKINEFLTILNKTTHLITESIIDKVKEFVKGAWDKIKIILNDIKGWIMIFFVKIKNFIKKDYRKYTSIKNELARYTKSEIFINNVLNKYNEITNNNVDLDTAIEILKTEVEEFKGYEQIVNNQANKIRNIIEKTTIGINNIDDIEIEDLENIPDKFVNEKLNIKNFIKKINFVHYNMLKENEENIANENIVIRSIKKVVSLLLGPIVSLIDKYKKDIKELENRIIVNRNLIMSKIIIIELLDKSVTLSKKTNIKESLSNRIFEGVNDYLFGKGILFTGIMGVMTYWAVDYVYTGVIEGIIALDVGFVLKSIFFGLLFLAGLIGGIMMIVEGWEDVKNFFKN